MKELITALVKAKKEFKPIVKETMNPFFKKKYADLTTVLEAIEPALLNNGLVVLQPTKVIDGKTYLTTQLWHESGQCIESAAYPIPDTADPQKLGSAITYARRYQLSAFLGVSADNDDDGNAISTNSNQSRPSGKAAATAKPQVSETRKKLCAQIQALRGKLEKSKEEALKDLGVSDLSEAPDQDLVALIAAYQSQVEESQYQQEVAA